MYLHAMEQACDLYSEGALTEEKWQSRYKQIGWIANRPGFAEYWKEFGKVYADNFASYVNQILRYYRDRANLPWRFDAPA